MSTKTTVDCLKEIEDIGPLNLHKNPDYMLGLLSAKIVTLLRTMQQEEQLSISALARKLNTSKQYLNTVLREDTSLSLKFLIKIAIALNCEIDIKIKLPEEKPQ